MYTHTHAYFNMYNKVDFSRLGKFEQPPSRAHPVGVASGLMLARPNTLTPEPQPQ